MVIDTAFPEMTTETIHGEKFLLERAIETMASERRCVHPVHRHAFRQVNIFTSLFSGTAMRKCEGCQGRLRSSLLSSGDDAHQQVVKCVTCGVLAHRHCALSRTNPWQGSQCRGPEPAVPKKRQKPTVIAEQQQTHRAPSPPAFAAAAAVSGCYHVDENAVLIHQVSTASNNTVNPHDFSTDQQKQQQQQHKVAAAPQPPPKSLFPFLSATSLLKSTRKLDVNGDLQHSRPDVNENDHNEIASSQLPPAMTDGASCKDQEEQNQQSSLTEQQQQGDLTWTPQGPPPHWASTTSTATDNHDSFHIDEKNESESSSAYDFVNQSLSSVTRALHDSITTPLLRRLSFESDYTRSEASSHGLIRAESKELEHQVVAVVHQHHAPPNIQETNEPVVDSKENIGNEARSPMNFVHHSFATVSRVLQENIMANFQPKPSDDNGDKEEALIDINQVTEYHAVKQEEEQGSEDDKVMALATETDSIPSKSNAAVNTFSTDRASRLRLATVAGGIAGGVAGLIIAGPAGAVLGAKCAQTAGVLGILLEGSVQIGVVVAGVAAAKYTAEQFQQMEEKRFLTIGGGKAGESQSEVLLVRPNVVVDPMWEDICANARKSAQNSGGPQFSPFKLFPKAEEKEAEMAKRERYHRDSDIVQTDEEEIPTADKILLLVSRILNDKSSLPGYVYRYLIKEFKSRCQAETKSVLTNGKAGDADHEARSTLMRARRQDAHAVIKHVTATLIDVRPSFASSPTITELTAAAVESLVFGELYDLVLEEIVNEEKAADELLLEKIGVVENNCSDGAGPLKESLKHLSQPAIQTLQLLPQAHSAVEKLRVCVHFLDCIAQHFAASPSPEEDYMGADSLLRMACQHIVAAKVPNLNAEIAFVEEFARDEQLLCGKEGYALVTLQASTHFLNLSDNLCNDVFAEADEVLEEER